MSFRQAMAMRNRAKRAEFQRFLTKGTLGQVPRDRNDTLQRIECLEVPIQHEALKSDIIVTGRYIRYV